MHASFGVLMLGSAVFSVRPGLKGVAFDPVEDGLHSFTATAMGFAFAFRVLVHFLQRLSQDRSGWLLDVIALVAAVGIPLLMVYVSDISGLIQRLMFLVAYIWYEREATILRGLKG
jgi:hypothetical protein